MLPTLLSIEQRLVSAFILIITDKHFLNTYYVTDDFSNIGFL